MAGGALGFIRLGDAVEGGGEVLTASGTLIMVGGVPAALVDDHVRCDTHQGVFPITEGTHLFKERGRPVAVHGSRLACGCKLVSQVNHRWGTSPKQEARHDVAASPATSLRSAWAPGEPTTSPATLTDHPVRPAHTIGVTLRIGVFFDGTNNNANNTAMGTQCRASTGEALGDDEIDREAIAAHCKPYMLKEGSSYENGITNVARLHDLYSESRGEQPVAGGEYFMRVYVDGAGTTAGARDTRFPGQALGVGKTGVVARVKEAFAVLIQERISQLVGIHPDVQIDAIEFDTFGFSRGAASARHFVNQVNRRQAGPLGPLLTARQPHLKPGFDWAADIRMGFVGLFDTVVSVGSLADGLSVRDDDDRGVEAALPAGCARQVVHLTARDEKRANFMLTTTKPEYPDIPLPGVHSDVGGSYNKMEEDPKWLTKPVGYDEGPAVVGTLIEDPEVIRQSRAYRQAAQDLVYWQNQLGVPVPDHLYIESWTWFYHKRDLGQVTPMARRRVYAGVKLKRPIDWRYQLIPLRLMHKLASEAGVQWEQSPGDVPDFALPDELLPIAAKLLAQQPLSVSEDALLRRKYLHQSSHWNTVTGKGPVSLDLIYAMRPDPSGGRIERPNE